MSGETAEQARTRRRWISLAEFVAVAGLLIGALTLWLNWAERREDKATEASEAAAERQAKDVVTLTGTVADGGRTIALADASRSISAATVSFPKALGIATQDAMPGPRIDSDWFDDALLKLTDGGADDRSGRLPALVTIEWWDGDARHTATARYDILWRTEGRILRGRALRLTGLALADRSASPAALDKAWKARAPR